MMATLSIKLFFIALASGFVSALLPGASRKRAVWPKITLATAAMLALMFAVQSAQPGVLPLFARDPSLVQRGQLWRAITALFFQDGGLAGFLFNLVILLLIGTVAERRLGANRWLLTYLGGGVISEFLALAWQPHGAGNSVACFALAGALVTFYANRKLSVWQIAVRLAGIAAGIGLIVMKDIHGLAFGVGTVLGILFAIRESRRAASGPASETANLAAQP
jgi:rhomboid protease GluP